MAQILGDGKRERSRMFSTLQSHYLFEDKFGRPGKGNDKGKVEGLVGYSRRHFMVPMPVAESFGAINARFLEQCMQRRQAVLRGHSTSIGERMQADLEAFMPLPAVAFDPCHMVTGRASSMSLVRYRTNDYSVPTAYAHQEVVIKGYVDRVAVICRGEQIAVHPRSHEREDFIGPHTGRLSQTLPPPLRPPLSRRYTKPVVRSLDLSGRQWIGAAIEQGQIVRIGVDPAALPSRGLADDAYFGEIFQRRAGGREGDGEFRGDSLDGDDRAGLHQFVDPERRRSRAAEAGDLLSVSVEHGDQIASRGGSLFRGLRDAGQEEFHPGLPRPSLPNLLQEPVIVVAPGLQEQAEIEDRFPQHPGLTQDQRDEQPAQASVAVEKGMDRLELDVGQARPDERGQRRILAVQEALERIEAFIQPVRRRRHEQGVARPGSADSVLRAAELARLLRCATP